MDEQWQIEMLGGLRLVRGDQVLDRFRTRKTGLLLAFLALHPRTAHARDALADLLWPDALPDAARTSLRVALSSLRRQLQPPGAPSLPLLLIDPFFVRLAPVAFLTDVARFEAALAAAERAPTAAERSAHLAEAIAAYTGELLTGYYDTWLLAERERLALLFETAKKQLAACRPGAALSPAPPTAPHTAAAPQPVPQAAASPTCSATGWSCLAPRSASRLTRSWRRSPGRGRCWCWTTGSTCCRRERSGWDDCWSGWRR